MQDAPELLRGLIAQEYPEASDSGWLAADDPAYRETGNRDCESGPQACTLGGDTCPVTVCDEERESGNRNCSIARTCTLEGANTCPVGDCDAAEVEGDSGNRNCETLPNTCTLDGNTCPVESCVHKAAFRPMVAGWSAPPPPPSL